MRINSPKPARCSECDAIKRSRSEAVARGDFEKMRAMTIRMGVHQREVHG